MKIGDVRAGNVISMLPIRSDTRFPALNQVETYWEGLRDARAMPARSEVDPRGLSEALTNAFILESIAPGIARIRLAGRHLSDLMGMEVRGMPLTALFVPAARAEVQRALTEVLDRPASLRLRLVSDKGFTRPRLEAGMYLAPLKDEAGQPTRVLGALQSRGDIGRAPRRMHIRACSVRGILSDTPTGVASEQTASGFAEGFADFGHTAADDPGPAGSHLRLVACNEDL